MKLEDLCLSPEAGAVELVIDLSNVCRESRLGPSASVASWDRFLEVLKLWNDLPNAFPMPIVLAVADNSLRYHFSDEDREIFKKAIREGFVIESEKADPIILELADKSDCTVLSNDNFLGYRRSYSWMEEEPPRFAQIGTECTPAELEILTLAKRTGYSKSRAEEADWLKELRIDLESAVGRDILKSLYRCDNESCLRRAVGNHESASAPQIAQSGELLCSVCKHRLTVVAGAPRIAILKATSVNESSTQYFSVAKGEEIVIGRSESSIPLDSLLSTSEISRVSRQHLRISFDGHNVVITDLGSGNGSTIQEWSKSNRFHLGPEQMLPHVARKLRPRGVATLSSVLDIERSGRRQPFDVERVV